MSPLEQRPHPTSTTGVQVVGPATQRYPQCTRWSAAVHLDGKRIGWVFFTRDRQSRLRTWSARDTRGRQLHLYIDGRPVVQGRHAVQAVLHNAGWVR